MTYFDERLKELHRQKLQKKRLEAMKAELTKQEDEVAKKAAELDAIKKKEQLDVDKLEGKTIKALFFTLSGTKEEKLSQERQEAYVAAMKYDAAMRDLEGIMHDLRVCNEELGKSLILKQNTSICWNRKRVLSSRKLPVVRMK